MNTVFVGNAYFSTFQTHGFGPCAPKSSERSGVLWHKLVREAPAGGKGELMHDLQSQSHVKREWNYLVVGRTEASPESILRKAEASDLARRGA